MKAKNNSHNDPFDFDTFKQRAKDQLKAGGTLLGTEGVLTPLIKAYLEETFEAELEAHLQEQGPKNRSNGKGKKTVKTALGQVEIQTSRDRNSSFDPQIFPKRQTRLGTDLDRQIGDGTSPVRALCTRVQLRRSPRLPSRDV